MVLDTTTLLRAIPTRSALRPIIVAFEAGKFVLVISNDVLFEYEEILKLLGAPDAWTALRELLDDHPADVLHVQPSYHWNAIHADPDDNKFVDAAVAGGAEWIVTDEAHFRALHTNSSLTVRPLPPAEFVQRYC